MSLTVTFAAATTTGDAFSILAGRSQSQPLTLTVAA